MREGTWKGSPINPIVSDASVAFETPPQTDLWQRTYYGFRVANAPAYLWTERTNFSFTAKCTFAYSTLFDQCGVVLYLDDENWFKASIEFESNDFSRLGSVVTNLGHSDWATTDIPTTNAYWYRLSRRGPDFLIEGSDDGEHFSQMRVFHLHRLGETTTELGRQVPVDIACEEVQVGVYACSPTDGTFHAEFSDIQFEASHWQAHGTGPIP